METKPVPTPLPIGHSFFDEVIECGCYYVDKTLLARDIIASKAKCILCTRPRRFGKTLNQTMLKCFFEDTAPLADTIYGKDKRPLFNGLNIEKAGERYMVHQGRYPVIFLSFKEGKRSTFEDAYDRLKGQLIDEFKRHRYALEKVSDDDDRVLFEKLASGRGTPKEYTASLKFLSKCLENYHGVKTIILIDEYDVPLENAWVCRFYDDMINFMRPLLSDALKDNEHLQFSVITGCLRISKESIFTGLNNLSVVSILSRDYDEYFGFTQNEVDAMLGHYGLMSKRPVIRDWYNGYLFGGAEVYNPWSTVNMVKDWLGYIDQNPKRYWANTSGNDIVRKLIDMADDGMKDDLDILTSGGTISKTIHEDITYDEIDKNAENLWNFLFFTGYLKKVGESVDHRGRIIVEMKIPNRELEIVFEDKILEWFDERIKAKDLAAFFNAVICGDARTVQYELSGILSGTISFMDSAENFYHGFLAGIFSQCPNGYKVKSNRESGDGRSDIVMRSANPMDAKAFIFEIKLANQKDKLPAACDEALKQIDDNNYAADLIEDGYDDITKYGVAFCKKHCMVKTVGYGQPPQ